MLKFLSDYPLAHLTVNHDAFLLIKNRIGDNQRKTWCKGFVEEMNNIELTTENSLEHYLDIGKRAGLPHLNMRVHRLVESGNFGINSFFVEISNQ